MSEEPAAPPKRVAMQVALAAEQQAAANAEAIGNLAQRVNDLAGELGNFTALAEAAAESGGGAPVGGVLAELRDTVGELLDWRAGFLGADGPKGVSKIAERIEDVHKAVQQVIDLIPGNLWAGQGGALATQQQVAEMAAQVAELAEWRAAELDPDNLGSDDALRERVAELETELAHLRVRSLGQAAPQAGGNAAPHVLSLIAALQKRVHEISKGREFKAENQRGETTQRYSFRGIDEAQNAIGSAQREIGLIGPKVTIVEKSVSVNEVNKGSYTQVWTTVSVTARYTFQSPIDGSEWSTEGCGMGRDLGDKAESKALAGAFKYALFHGLNIPVKGVFVDAETEDPRIEQDNADRREQRGYAQDRVDRDAGRTYGSGQAPQGWRPDDGRDRPRDADELDRSPVDPPGDVESAAAGVRRAQQDDTRPPEQLAHDALKAIRSATSLPDAAKIWTYVHQRGCLSQFIDGAQLGHHMLAAIRILPGGQALAPSALPGLEHFL